MVGGLVATIDLRIQVNVFSKLGHIFGELDYILTRFGCPLAPVLPPWLM